MIVPVVYKRDRYDCSNDRGLTLISVAMKIFEQIIDNKIRAAIEKSQEESLTGFREESASKATYLR